MDQIIIDSTSDSILRCIHRIKSRLPETKALFLQDLDAQDVVVLNLSRCVQLQQRNYHKLWGNHLMYYYRLMPLVKQWQ